VEEKINTFRDLRIWQKGIELVKEIYRITNHFPKEEQYCLTSQMRRAAVSVPTNVAEGFRRHHPKEYKQFINIALGSLGELETLTVIAEEQKYINAAENARVLELINYLCGMSINLSKKL